MVNYIVKWFVFLPRSNSVLYNVVHIHANPRLHHVSGLNLISSSYCNQSLTEVNGPLLTTAV